MDIHSPKGVGMSTLGKLLKAIEDKGKGIYPLRSKKLNISSNGLVLAGLELDNVKEFGSNYMDKKSFLQCNILQPNQWNYSA
jgi:hypothetical protein